MATESELVGYNSTALNYFDICNNEVYVIDMLHELQYFLFLF